MRVDALKSFRCFILSHNELLKYNHLCVELCSPRISADTLLKYWSTAANEKLFLSKPGSCLCLKCCWGRRINSKFDLCPAATAVQKKYFNFLYVRFHPTPLIGELSNHLIYSKWDEMPGRIFKKWNISPSLLPSFSQHVFFKMFFVCILP